MNRFEHLTVVSLAAMAVVLAIVLYACDREHDERWCLMKVTTTCLEHGGTECTETARAACSVKEGLQ